MVGCDAGSGVEPESTFSSHLHLGPPHMMLLEEKLPVEVAHFDCVQINLQVGSESLWVGLSYQVDHALVISRVM